MQSTVSDRGAGAIPERPPGTFDAKRDLGKPVLRRLKRARAILILARSVNLPGRERLARRMWSDFLEVHAPASAPGSPIDRAGVGVRPCANWWELKYWTFVASCFEQHSVYEWLLSTYDEIVPLARSRKECDAEFVGSGHGQSTLNTYRVFRFAADFHGERACFEKVYNTRYDDHRRVTFIGQGAAEPLRSVGIVLPRILTTVTGQELAITYSEYLGGRRLSDRLALRRSADIIEVLMGIPVASTEADERLRVYHPTIKTAFGSARAWLLQRRPELCEAFDRTADRIRRDYPRCLAHGDLHRKNMLTSGGVLDWDTAGVYPIGFDPGMILSKSVDRGSIQGLESMVGQYFLRGPAKQSEEAFLHATLFFGFVFGAGKRSSMPEALLLELAEHVLGAAPENRQ